MSKKFELLSKYAIHDEGTKYYQVFMIREVGKSNGIVVTHWGKMHPGAPSTPKGHGQHKVEKHSTGIISEFNGAVKNKQKRGYAKWENRLERLDLSEFDLHVHLHEEFNASEALDMMLYLKGHPVSEDIPFGEIDELDEEEPRPAKTPAAPTLNMSTKENWGSW